MNITGSDGAAEALVAAEPRSPGFGQYDYGRSHFENG